MKILMVNKFLYPNGGSETYIFELGKQLQKMGHEVQYFGMEHPDRCVGNSAGAYTSNMDFHSSGKAGGLTAKLAKLTYPFKIIYSFEARKKIRLVLEDMKPDVVHLNNINFQITPSIIYEIKKWNMACKIVATIHDPQWVCPNHMLINGKTHKGCTKCFNGKYYACTRDCCIHDSKVRSFLGTSEAILYRIGHVYRLVDAIICPSHFMEGVMKHNPDIDGRTVMLRNFISISESTEVKEDRYVLYFGRFSEEKGIRTVIEAAKRCEDIPFIFAGNGPYEDEVNQLTNVKNVGFVTGEKLSNAISNAQFSLIASECYENCPFSVMESQMLGTPVIGANIGGIPELIEDGVTGRLFESGNSNDLAQKIENMWNNKNLVEQYSENCRQIHYDSIEEYTKKVIMLYEGNVPSK